MKKKSTAKKVLLTILGILLALVIVLVGTVYVVWHDEITTLLSFQHKILERFTNTSLLS